MITERKFCKVYKIRVKEIAPDEFRLSSKLLIRSCKLEEKEEKGFRPLSNEKKIMDSRDLGPNYSGGYHLVTQKPDKTLLLYSDY